MKHISHSINKFMEDMETLYGKENCDNTKEIDYRLTIDVSFIVDNEEEAIRLMKKDVHNSFEGHTKMKLTKIEKKGERLWEWMSTEKDQSKTNQ